MRAMILAAGRGERMKPLTDTCPKPLLVVAGKPLIVYHIEKLANIGVKEIVINHAWLGQQLVDYLGNGDKWQVTIKYSDESHGALETAGGIKKALNLLNPNNTDDPFLVINGDIYFEYDLVVRPRLSIEHAAHLWLIDNPTHNMSGDFSIENGLLMNQGEPMWTFSGIALYRPSFFYNVSGETVERLAPLLRAAASQYQVSASVLSGKWVDVGTPERLQQLDQFLLSSYSIGK